MSDTTKNNIKGFITDLAGNTILPITRGELVLDANGEVALRSLLFAANKDRYGLLSPTHYELLESLGSNDTPNADNLAGILTKLTAINDGIWVDTTQLHFYDNNNQDTPIIFKSSETISLTADDSNNITVSLKPLLDKPTNAENVVANITVDEYGRVTEISSTTALSGVSLTGCTTEPITETSNKSAIVDKQYVDDRFGDISAISTGALKFRGTISNADNIETFLQEENCYYLIGADFSIPKEYVHGKLADVLVTTGDTLIVYKKNDAIKFEFIPSGNDTSIINLYDSQNDEPTIIGVGLSNIRLEYPFEVTKDNNDINISIPEASYNTSGILSVDLYNEIKTATAKSMSYSQIIETGVPLGKILIGDNTELPTIIYSPDYSLKYLDATIKWLGYNKDTGENEELNIQFGGGLLHTHSADTSTILVNLGTDNKYLKVDNGVLTAIISQESLGGDTGFTQGLINDALLSKYTAVLATAAYYESISTSLNDDYPEYDNGPTYKYGSQDLKDAIEVTI